MATTTNYGWTTPDDTALVKDGASAIRTLGTSVDTTTKNLNPSTTLGDIEYRSSTANTNTRLPLGTANQLLRVNSGATAPEWATISTGGMTLISTTSLSGASVSLSSIPATYKNLQLVIRDLLPATDNVDLHLRLNGDSTANRYASVGINAAQGGTVAFTLDKFSSLANAMDNAVTENFIVINFIDYANTSTWKYGESRGLNVDATTTTNYVRNNYSLYYNQTAAISSIDIFLSSGNITSGTALLYGVS